MRQPSIIPLEEPKERTEAPRSAGRGSAEAQDRPEPVGQLIVLGGLVGKRILVCRVCRRLQEGKICGCDGRRRSAKGGKRPGPLEIRQRVKTRQRALPLPDQPLAALEDAGEGGNRRGVLRLLFADPLLPRPQVLVKERVLLLLSRRDRRILGLLVGKGLRTGEVALRPIVGV